MSKAPKQFQKYHFSSNSSLILIHSFSVFRILNKRKCVFYRNSTCWSRWQVYRLESLPPKQADVLIASAVKQYSKLALPKAALKKLFKEEVINLALDYQSEFDSTLGWIRNEFSEMKKDFEKLGEKSAVSKHINGMLEKRVINMERKCWSNNQYCRQEYLEVTGIPDSIESKDLE